MNKKKIVTGLLSTAFLGGVLVTTALPAEATDYNEQSNGSIKFKSGGLVIPPPGPDIEPGDNDGEIGLLYVPKELNFQETAVPTSVVSTITVIPIDPNWEGSPGAPTSTPTGSNPLTKRVQIGDVRGTRASGWKLEAKLTAELSTGSKDLTGATITMTQTLNDLDPNTGIATPVTVTPHTPDTVTSGVTLDTSSSLIMSASAETGPGKADGRGEGYWQGTFTNINLNIPPLAMNAVTAGEQYTGTVDWTLTDAI